MPHLKFVVLGLHKIRIINNKLVLTYKVTFKERNSMHEYASLLHKQVSRFTMLLDVKCGEHPVAVLEDGKLELQLDNDDSLSYMKIYEEYVKLSEDEEVLENKHLLGHYGENIDIQFSRPKLYTCDVCNNDFSLTECEYKCPTCGYRVGIDSIETKKRKWIRRLNDSNTVL